MARWFRWKWNGLKSVAKLAGVGVKDVDISWTVIALLPPQDIKEYSGKLERILRSIQQINTIYPECKKESDALARCKAVEAKVPSEGYVKEPSRRIPLIATADVAVVGGGPAGVAAAVSAARSGASVILLEKNWFLGGLWTGGLVLPVIAHSITSPSPEQSTILEALIAQRPLLDSQIRESILSPEKKLML